MRPNSTRAAGTAVGRRCSAAIPPRVTDFFSAQIEYEYDDSGFYFDEPGQAETLLAPAVEKSSAWK
jgi:hypothetical protein